MKTIDHTNPGGTIVNVRIARGVRIAEYVSIAEGVSIAEYVSIARGVSLPRSPLSYRKIFVFNEYAQGYIRIGCEVRSITEWEANFDAILAPHNVPADRKEVYKILIQAVKELQRVQPLGTTGI